MAFSFFQDQKKFQGQVNTEQETASGSTPSPNRPLGPKKVVGPRTNGAASNGTPNRRLSLNSNGSRSMGKDNKRENRPGTIVNFVSISKEDAASPVSATDSSPVSP